MKLVITAGGTSEKIDDVRKITNMATGKLGSLIASAFVALGENKIEKIYYVCEQSTIVPTLPCVEVIDTRGVDGLKAALEKIFASNRIDAVVHSMAVSDYAVRSVTTTRELAGSITQQFITEPGRKNVCSESMKTFVEQALQETSVFKSMQKIPSDIDDLVITLRRTPKIISLFKALQPETLLVGFKLLSGVPEGTLLKAGFEIMEKNGCDLVFANDAESLTDGGQIGYLLSPDGSSEKLDGKPAIARRIAQVVLSSLESRGIE